MRGGNKVNINKGETLMGKRREYKEGRKKKLTEWPLVCFPETYLVETITVRLFVKKCCGVLYETML